MLNELSHSLDTMIIQVQSHYLLLAKMLVLFFGVYLLTVLSGGRLLCLGIYPRRLFGLPGIFFSPFLHANFNHLFFNMIPLTVLSMFVLLGGETYFYHVSFWLIVSSGFLVWCFGKSGFHVGASSLITGYWGFLVANSFSEGGVVPIVLGVVCIYYLFGIFLSICPQEKGISWEGHLFGLVSGIGLSTWYTHVNITQAVFTY